MTTNINGKNYPITKYLSTKQVNQLIPAIPAFSFWKEANDFGLKYKAIYLGEHLVTERKNSKDKVFLCMNNKGYWLTLVYGHNNHFESVETLKYSGLWSINPEKWEKIVKATSL